MFCFVMSDGIAAARCKAIMADVLSGLVSPIAAGVAPRKVCVWSTASVINCAICGEICAGSIILATFVTSPPLTPIARPTPLSHFCTRVLSYTTFGKAVVMSETMLIA